MQKIWILLSVIIFSCSSNPNNPIITSSDLDSPTKVSFPTKPLQILNKNDTDIRLSYTETSSNGRSINYKVNSTFENGNLGFELFVPVNGSGRLVIKSTGSNSDRFIQFLAKLYKQEIDTATKFADLIKGDCINMGEYIANLNQEKREYSTPAQYKIFLKGAEDISYGELYLNIDTIEHFIEIGEKDHEYRQAIVSLFSKSK